MTINHHPNTELLLDYATGALGEGWSLAVATHLALCPKCRDQLSELEAIGGNLLDSMVFACPTENILDKVLERLDGSTEDAGNIAAPSIRNGGPPVLPQPLRDYVGGDLDTVDWQRLGLGAYQALIPTTNDGVTVRLLRIPAGQPVPEHSHRGLELTLVLAGGFSDATGHFARGDFEEADEELQHQPTADPGNDCICLAVTDQPLRFASPLVRLLQPFLGI